MTLEPSDESSEHFLGVSMGRLLKAYSASNVKRASSGERDKPEVDNAYSCEAQPLDDGYGGEHSVDCFRYDSLTRFPVSDQAPPDSGPSFTEMMEGALEKVNKGNECALSSQSLSAEADHDTCNDAFQSRIDYEDTGDADKAGLCAEILDAPMDDIYHVPERDLSFTINHFESMAIQPEDALVQSGDPLMDLYGLENDLSRDIWDSYGDVDMLEPTHSEYPPQRTTTNYVLPDVTTAPEMDYNVPFGGDVRSFTCEMYATLVL